MKNNGCLSFNRAVDLLHHKGVRLMQMHAADGIHFYIVPGGRVARDDAKKILALPNIVEFDDGLFPGNPQSWRIAP